MFLQHHGLRASDGILILTPALVPGTKKPLLSAEGPLGTHAGGLVEQSSEKTLNFLPLEQTSLLP